MNCWIVIPVKAPADCKTRLSPILDEPGRQDLVAAMLHRAYAAACAVAGPERVLLLGPSRHGLPDHVPLLDDPGQGLNPAMASALRKAEAAGVERLILLFADLPRIEADDVAALVEVAAGSIAAAPDQGGTGTNALSLPLPQAGDFRFHYGENSFAAHREEAARLALPFHAIVRPGLGFDIDRPDDLTRWRAP